MTTSSDRRVVFQPAAGRALKRGAVKLVDAVRPTIGPLPRYTAVERATRTSAAELLDQAGVIARRVIALPQPDEDMGAMLVRHLMWRMDERLGDGAATAAVLFQAIYEEGLRLVAAGANPMRLRKHLVAAGRVAQGILEGLACPIEGQEALARLAETVCRDPDLARMLGEIFDIIGEYGQLDVRASRGRDLEREYVEGMFWTGGVLSRELADGAPRSRVELEDAEVLVSNLEIQDAHRLAEFLGTIAAAGAARLFLVAQSISTEAMSVILVNNRAGRFKVVAARLSELGRGAWEDFAVLTGARPVLSETGATLAGVQLTDLGRARRVWADKEYTGVIGGQGAPTALRSHLAMLRGQYARSEGDDRMRLRHRIGRLQGGSATLWVGAATEAEMEARKDVATRAGEALRAALTGGIVPGGGAAYLACREPLRRAAVGAGDAEESNAYRILVNALEAPARVIATNAGCDIAHVLAAIDAAPAGWGCDARTGTVVDMLAAGIVDVADVVREALAAALSAATMALTTDVLVHRNKPGGLAGYEP